MVRPFDMSDIPFAGRADMAVALEAVVVSGCARVFFEGASRRDRAAVEAVFWRRFTGHAANGGAALTRLWSLVDVFQSRRLQRRLMSEGYRFLRAAVLAAGELRLNANWGLNPQKVLWAVPEVGPGGAFAKAAAAREACGAGAFDPLGVVAPATAARGMGSQPSGRRAGRGREAGTGKNRRQTKRSTGYMAIELRR